MSLKWPLPNKPRSASIGSGGAPSTSNTGHTGSQADCIPLVLPKLDLLAYRLSLKPVVPKRDLVEANLSANANHISSHGTPLPGGRPDAPGHAISSQQLQQPFQLAASLLGIPSHSLSGQTPGPQTPISTLASTLAGSSYPLAAAALSTPAAHPASVPAGSASGSHDAGHASLLPGWRIRWACYIASQPVTATTLPAAESLPTWAQKDFPMARLKPPPSAINTQASPSDVFAFNISSSPRLPSVVMSMQRPLSARGTSVLGKRRSRTVSIISQSDQKRPHLTPGASQLFRRRPQSSATATRPQLILGDAAESAVRRVLRNLERLNRPALDILLEAQSRWNKSANVEGRPLGRRMSNASVNTSINSEAGIAKKDLLAAAPKLPDRVSHLQAVQTQSAPSTVEHKLWLFALVEPGRHHPLDELDIDYFGSFDGIEIQNSGSFTAQDIFPTLYNENGLYAPPEARPVRHFASCLNIGEPANVELAQASKLFLEACRQHLVHHMRENCQLSGYARGISSGTGVIWAGKRSLEHETPTAIYCSLDVQYDHEGLFVKGFLDTLPQIGISQHTQAATDSSPAVDPRAGDLVLLLPMAVTATFVRKYGHEATSSPLHNAVTARQAAAEQQQTQFILGLNNMALSPSPDQSGGYGTRQYWLCRITGVDIIWSAAHSLLLAEPLNRTISAPRPAPTHLSDVVVAALLDQHTLDRSIALTSACIDGLVEDRERQRNKDAKSSAAGSSALITVSSILSPQQLDSNPFPAAMAPRCALNDHSAPLSLKSLSELAAFLPPPSAATAAVASFAETPEVMDAPVAHGTTTHTPKDHPDPIQPIKPALQPVNDAFSDFLWTDFSSFGAQDRSRTHMRDLDYSSGLTGLFDAPITEDDFSFFDTPALPSADIMHDMIPERSALPSGAADFAFVTSSEPVDHFGHLMPSGNSPTVAITGTTSASFYPMAYSSIPSANLGATTLAFPSGVANDTVTTQPSTEAYDIQPFTETLTIVDNPYATPEGLAMTPLPVTILAPEKPKKLGKYDIANVSALRCHATHSSLSQFGEVALRDVGNAYTRLGDTSDDMPHRVIAGTTALEFQMRERSRLLLKHVSGLQQQQLDEDFRALKLRTWSTPSDASSLTFDSSSSDDLTDEEATSPFDVAELAASAPEATERFATARAIMMPDILHGPSIAAVLRSTLAVTISFTETLTSEDKLSKSEREALLSIFFVQVTENPAFRHSCTATVSRKPGIARIRPSSHVAALSKLAPVFDTHASLTTVTVNRAIAPRISVAHHSAVMRMDASALHHWDIIGLQPISGEKNTFVRVICGAALATSFVKLSVQGWLRTMDSEWKNCNFGRHGSHSEAETGLLVLDTGAINLTEVPEEILAEKLAPLQAQVIRQTKAISTGVIYILLSDQECHNASRKLMRLCLRIHLLRKGFVPHILPLSAITAPSVETALPTSRRMYERIPVVSERFNPYLAQTSRNLKALGQTFRPCPAPSFKLSSATRQPPIFSMAWPTPTMNILTRNSLLHVAYEITDDRRVLTMSLIDEKAEHHSTRARWVEHLDIKAIIKRVWSFMKDITHAVSMEWRVVIIKASFMDRTEIQTWSDLLTMYTATSSKPMSISICSLGAAAEISESQSDAFQPTAMSTSHAVHAYGRTDVLVNYSRHPTAVYLPDPEAAPSLPIPDGRKRAYFAMSASSVYFVDMRVSRQSARLLPPPKAARSYAIYFLLTVASPACSYPLLLGRHVREVTQSFIDLQFITAERWAMHENDVEALPWHLAAVQTLCRYDVTQLFSDG